MTKRKTFDVAYFRGWINERLASNDLSQDEKKALCMTAEFVLGGTENYKGFGYNDPRALSSDSFEYNRRYFG